MVEAGQLEIPAPELNEQPGDSMHQMHEFMNSDDNGNIEEAFIPSFNVMNIFLIPKMHSVQFVSPFAGANRTSYLGWLHR